MAISIACKEETLVSLLDAAVAKYQKDMCDDSLGVLVSRSPPGRTTTEGHFLLPMIICMDACSINHAGDEKQLTEIFKLVEELDLMKNEFKSWDEIRTILRCSPCLRALNLSQNPLGLAGDSPDWPPNETFSRVVTLALNSTDVSWRQILNLLPHFPELQDLHIAMNELCHVPESSLKFHSVNRLIYNNNAVVSFKELLRLSNLFPCLEHLLVSGNGIEEIGKTISRAKKQDRLLFNFLSYLNLSDNFIAKWCCVDELALLPTLIDLRLNGNPLLENLPISEARMQAISRLPDLVRLNGSPIGAEEREDAERAFIRLYMDEETKPQRYSQLVKKHGKLDPLANVDLKPQSVIKFHLRYENMKQSKELNINQNVSELKKEVCQMFGKTHGQVRLFYLDKEINYEEELKYPRRKMHSYRPKDGDELILSPK